jgi:DNA polymerase-3 subunit gamma/tau
VIIIGYVALYRKYRPQLFSEVVGQEHITKTLKNQVKTDKVAHAYLFSGPRGTGKTSIAKILSRAVNCLNIKDGDPCNECEICKGIMDGSIMDVIEIDAASNNSVDNVRDIRDEIIYTPSKSKYKVYIILYNALWVISDLQINLLPLYVYTSVPISIFKPP